MKTFLRVLIHILAYPALIAVIVIANLGVINDSFNNYTYWTLIGIAITVVMAIIFYVVYLIVTREKSKLSKFAQTAIVSLTAVATLGGTWVACDRLLPDIIDDATSGTIFYEDLAEESWKIRADVNKQLIDEFIEMNVLAQVLPLPEDMTTEEAIEYYQKLGVDKEIPEIKAIEQEYGEEYPFHTVNELLAIQYQSINANGYSSFHDPWIGFATSSRLTIPCLLHLLLDKRTVDPDDIDNLDSPTITYHEEGDEIVIDEVMFAVYDPETGFASCKPLSWTVLDMTGENQTFDIGSVLSSITESEAYGLVTTFFDIDTLLNGVTSSLSYILADKDLLGADLYVSFAKDEENNITGEISLVPSDTFLGVELANGIADNGKIPNDRLYARGAIDYMRMAWLDSNGLLFAIVMLMSVRSYFLYFAGWIGLLMFLEGFLRGMRKDEKEREKALIESAFGEEVVPKKKKQKLELAPVMTAKERKMEDFGKAIARGIQESKNEEEDDEVFTL